MSQFKGPAKCRVPQAAQYAQECCVEIRRSMVQLQADKWTGIEIAEYLGVSRRTLYRWRNGDEEPTYSQFLSLRALAAETSPRKFG